ADPIGIDRGMSGQLERKLVLHRPVTPVLDVAGQRLLLDIEVERGDTAARFQQRHDQMHGECRLAAAALVIADNDDVWAVVPGYNRRTQHAALPTEARCTSRDPPASPAACGSRIVHRVIHTREVHSTVTRKMAAGESPVLGCQGERPPRGKWRWCGREAGPRSFPQGISSPPRRP